MINIYHFCQDEKFINAAYLQFESLYPNQNSWFVYHTEIKDIKHIKVEKNFFHINDIASAFANIPDNTIAIFHSLPEQLLVCLDRIPKTVKVIWMVFGFEVYNDINLYPEVKSLDKETRSIFGETGGSGKTVMQSVKNIYRRIRGTYKHTRKAKKLLALQRVDYIGIAYRKDYEIVRKLAKLNRPFFQFCYYPLELIINTNYLSLNKQDKIMIGHSAYKTCNHLDVFSKLKKLQLQNHNIILPFSYGDETYRENIKELAELPNNHIEYLEHFLSLEKYNLLLSSVKAGIFNTRRQQALGNIIALVYSGAKVFISTQNSFYHYLRDNKVLVYSYEQDLTLENVRLQLSEEEINHNRSVIFQLFNKNKLELELDQSMQQLLQ